MAKKIAFFLLLMFSGFMLQAQVGNKVEMADAMHENGKIYVVVAVILTIFAGIIIYLVRIDKKISKIEKNNS
jgi:hypothetical protein